MRTLWNVLQWTDNSFVGHPRDGVSGSFSPGDPAFPHENSELNNEN
jgi:hypothetical protein